MKRRSSSDLSSDDHTLQSFNVNGKKRLTVDNKTDLYKFCQEKCEFCEELLFCSYDMLVHNAKHIIIPLKDELVQCNQCNIYFGSTMDLDIHTKTDHFKVPDILEKIVMKKPIVMCDNSIQELVVKSNENKRESKLFEDDFVASNSDIKDKGIEKLEQFVNKQPIIFCEDTVTKMLNEHNKSSYDDDEFKIDLIDDPPNPINDKLEQFISKQPVIHCEDIIKNILNGNIKNIPDDDKLKNDLTDSVPKVVINKNNLLQNHRNDITTVELTNRVKARLVFEDDDCNYEDDIISTNGIKNGGMNDFICDLTLDSSDDEVTRPSRTSVARTTRNTEICEDDLAPAIHYDDLMEPCFLNCTRCGLSFSNRYDLITHETKVHLKFKDTLNARAYRICAVCDMYLAGNHWTLKNHMISEHGSVTNKYPALKVCSKCNLKYYSYSRHSLKYHFIFICQICYKGFEKESELTEHGLTCKGRINVLDNIPQIVEDRIGIEKILKVCELCSLFFKNTKILKYVPLRDYSEQGKRITCERCEKQFFVVKLIKLINKHTIVQPFYEYHRKNTHASSNKDRLKKIQKRFKLMNRLNKFK